MRSGKRTISAQTMSNVCFRKITNSSQDVSADKADELDPLVAKVVAAMPEDGVIQ